MAISQEQARQELARRELARRELSKREQSKPMDIINSAASKAESIRSTPKAQKFNTMYAKATEFTDRALENTLVVPALLRDKKQSSLSTGAQNIAGILGSFAPIEGSIGAIAKISPKPLMTPKWIAGIADNAKTAVKGTITKLRSEYGNIFKANEAVKVPEKVLTSIPDFIKEQVGLTGKAEYSLDDLWKAREQMQDKLTKSFYQNKELFLKNKVSQKEISEASNATKAVVLNSLPKESRDAFMKLDALYSTVKNKSKALLKTDSKGIVGIYRDPLNAQKMLDIEELAKYVPELNKMKSDALGYISRQRNKIIAKDILLKSALPVGGGAAIGYALSQKAR